MLAPLTVINIYFCLKLTDSEFEVGDSHDEVRLRAHDVGGRNVIVIVVVISADQVTCCQLLHAAPHQLQGRPSSSLIRLRNIYDVLSLRLCLHGKLTGTKEPTYRSPLVIEFQLVILARKGKLFPPNAPPLRRIKGTTG